MAAVTRITDLDIVHCSLPVRAVGSPNVIVSGLPWSCVSHINVTHLLPGSPCPAHVAPIGAGSSSVFVNGLAAGRIGSPIVTCTVTASGSPNVFCGG